MAIEFFNNLAVPILNLGWSQWWSCLGIILIQLLIGCVESNPGPTDFQVRPRFCTFIVSQQRKIEFYNSILFIY